MAKVKTIEQSEDRYTFLIQSENVDKIKALAYWERTLLKDQVNAAFERHIRAYEKKNGPLQPIPNKKVIAA